MLLSLESLQIAGVFVVFLAGTVQPFHLGEERTVRPGSENMCKWTFGFPRNLRGPVISTPEISGWRYRSNNSRPIDWHAVSMGAKQTACSRGIAKRR